MNIETRSSLLELRLQLDAQRQKVAQLAEEATTEFKRKFNDRDIDNMSAAHALKSTEVKLYGLEKLLWEAIVKIDNLTE